MAAHRMAENALAAHVRREVRRDQLRQFVHNVGIHAIIAVIGRLRRVEIEARALAEAPILGIVGHVGATRRRIGADDDHAMGGGGGAELAFFRDIGVGAGQAGQIPQHRNLGVRGLRRDENRKSHRAIRRPRLMAVNALHAAMRFCRGNGFHFSISGLVSIAKAGALSTRTPARIKPAAICRGGFEQDYLSRQAAGAIFRSGRKGKRPSGQSRDWSHRRR